MLKKTADLAVGGTPKSSTVQQYHEQAYTGLCPSLHSVKLPNLHSSSVLVKYQDLLFLENVGKMLQLTIFVKLWQNVVICALCGILAK